MNENKSIVLLTDELSELVASNIDAHADLTVRRCANDAKDILEHIADVDALIVRTKSQVDEHILRAGTRLKVVGRAGIGLDNINLDVARELGIRVVHTPAASTEAVAQLSLGLLLSLERHISRAHRLHGQISHDRLRKSIESRQLQEMVIGIIGFGRIGERFAELLHGAFGCSILFYDIREVRTIRTAAEQVPMERLLCDAEVVSLHVPLTAQTQGMFGTDQFRMMRPDALLLNTARGKVVDCLALADALGSGVIRGAALDVTDPEPLPKTHPLRSCDNCIITPHIGARTHAAQTAMEAVVDDVVGVLRGSPPKFPAH